ncbi:MAG: phospho-N-acetylmuramoyl-pentapeptide-transferase, partial [Thermovibrio sp.]
MLYLILYKSLGINLFKYITFRSIYAAVTALFVGFLLYPYLERKLKNLQFEQTIKDYMPESHKKKRVPTMGGLLIIASLIFSVLLWNDLLNPFIWIVLFVVFSFGILGFVDDYIK